MPPSTPITPLQELQSILAEIQAEQTRAQRLADTAEGCYNQSYHSGRSVGISVASNILLKRIFALAHEQDPAPSALCPPL